MRQGQRKAAKLAKPDTKLIPADVSDMSVWLYLFAPGLHATSQRGKDQITWPFLDNPLKRKWSLEFKGNFARSSKLSKH